MSWKVVEIHRRCSVCTVTVAQKTTVMWSVCSIKSCVTGLQQLTITELWATLNNQLHRLTDIHAANHCTF